MDKNVHNFIKISTIEWRHTDIRIADIFKTHVFRTFRSIEQLNPSKTGNRKKSDYNTFFYWNKKIISYEYMIGR